jgi:hypothetical protein
MQITVRLTAARTMIRARTLNLLQGSAVGHLKVVCSFHLSGKPAGKGVVARTGALP